MKFIARNFYSAEECLMIQKRCLISDCETYLFYYFYLNDYPSQLYESLSFCDSELHTKQREREEVNKHQYIIDKK